MPTKRQVSDLLDKRSNALVVELLDSERPNIEEPRYDQRTYWGRAKHFFVITNPLNLFCTDDQLNRSKEIVENYRNGIFDVLLTVDALWRSKHIYDSAFHPETKEKMYLIGRMSAQVPTNMVICGGMMTFYNQLMASYIGATGGAVATAIGVNSLVKHSTPLIRKFVPWTAVAAANCVNIPLMSLRELQNGVTITDEHGKKLGESKTAAKRAIAMVILSRIAMVTPAIVIPPVILNWLGKKPWLAGRRYLNAVSEVFLVGVFLLFTTPMCCALFPQKSSISVTKLEPELKEKIAKLQQPPSTVYYNKGL